MTKNLIGMSFLGSLVACTNLSRSGEYQRESPHWITLTPPRAEAPLVPPPASKPAVAAMPELASLAPLPHPAHVDPHQPEEINPDLALVAETLPPAGCENWEKKIIDMNVSGYCACSLCCGWVRNPKGKPVYAAGPNKGKPKLVGFTASGKKAVLGTIAADIKVLPFGARVHVKGYGYGTVQDRGEAIQGAKLDLFFATHAEAQKWGRKTLPVTVWIAPDQDKVLSPVSPRR